MKLINPSVAILDTHGYDIDSIYKDIERAARNCYQSGDMAKLGSAEKMVNALIGSKHFSCLEFGTVYLRAPRAEMLDGNYSHNKYSTVWDYSDDECCVTTNYRTLVQNGWLNDLKYLCEPTDNHEKRICVQFITSIGISREFNRHRVNSITELSTRYVNFSKEKFGSEITCIAPHWLRDMDADNSYLDKSFDFFDHKNENYIVSIPSKVWRFIKSLCYSEETYFELLKEECKPQDARDVLPLATKTSLFHCTEVSNWKHFFELRNAPGAHPDARYLANILENEFKKMNLI